MSMRGGGEKEDVCCGVYVEPSTSRLAGARTTGADAGGETAAPVSLASSAVNAAARKVHRQGRWRGYLGA